MKGEKERKIKRIIMDKDLKEKLDDLEKKIDELGAKIDELKSMLTHGLKIQLKMPPPQVQLGSKILVPRLRVKK